jgi:hypothetical protein
MAVATTGALTQTLAQLRIRVAQRLGDHVPLTFTTNGTTTTCIDTRAINTATEDCKGRAILFSDGTVSRVTAQVDATSTLTFTPAVSNANLVEAGDVAHMFNKRSKGFTPQEYKDAINAAINDAFPLGLIEVTDETSAAFSEDTPEITVDTSLVYVHTVEWEDADGFWSTIPAATRTNQYGWIADGASGQIRLLGYPARVADGYLLRTVGYGRQDVLTAESDSCALNAEYIISRACYHLCMGNMDKDPVFGQWVGVFLNESDKKRSRIRTLNKGHLVRSV